MDNFLAQAGALPYRRLEDRLQILLVTSRSSGDWIAPKGMIDPGSSARQTALQEAYEEAGVRGELGPYLGTLHRLKLGYPVQVQIFALHVQQVLDPWLEKAYRQRRWFEAQQACQATRDDGLRDLMDALLRLTL
jgi:8-oxo-dGTP pyrophosphatase MutT (NUDIX family)